MERVYVIGQPTIPTAFIFGKNSFGLRPKINLLFLSGPAVLDCWNLPYLLRDKQSSSAKAAEIKRNEDDACAQSKQHDRQHHSVISSIHPSIVHAFYCCAYLNKYNYDVRVHNVPM